MNDKDGRLKMSPATISLDPEQIKAAIDEYVSSRGYRVIGVTLSVAYRDRVPDNFNAVVQVEPKSMEAMKR